MLKWHYLNYKARVDRLLGDTCSLCLSLDLAQLSQDRHMSVPNYGLFPRKLHLTYFAFFFL